MSIWLPLKNNFSDWIHTIYGGSSKIVIEDTVAWFAHEECHYTGYGMPACLNLYVIIQQTSNKFFTAKVNLCELQLLLKTVLYSLKGILLPFFLWSMHGYWSCGWLLLFLSHLKVLLKVQCSKLATIVCLKLQVHSLSLGRADQRSRQWIDLSISTLFFPYQNSIL